MIKDIDWETSINTRRSTRSFSMQPVEESKTSLLQSFINEMQLPFEHNGKLKLFKANSDKKIYSVFSSPPDNVAFISETDFCSISKAGFAGELFILYATSLGLATCWYGHYTLSELERVMPHLNDERELKNSRWGYGKGVVEGERVICISPVGYANLQGIRLFDRVQESLVSYKRKSINFLLDENITEDSLPSDIIYALDLARKAPSAANSQHWRFSFSSDFKVITLAMPVGYKHIKWEHPNVDIGICACHFWLGLQMKNIECNISIHEDQGRAVWQFECGLFTAVF